MTSAICHLQYRIMPAACAPFPRSWWDRICGSHTLNLSWQSKSLQAWKTSGSFGIPHNFVSSSWHCSWQILIQKGKHVPLLCRIFTVARLPLPFLSVLPRVIFNTTIVFCSTGEEVMNELREQICTTFPSNELLHSVWFIRNKAKFQIVLPLQFDFSVL